VENTPDPDLWKSRVPPPAPKPLRAVFVYYTETKTALTRTFTDTLGGEMGLFWDLMQQSEISEQRDRSASLQTRVEGLETELRHTKELLRTVIERLEKHVKADLDADGKVGR
jgi:hypothetical protein